VSQTIGKIWIHTLTTPKKNSIFQSILFIIAIIHGGLLCFYENMRIFVTKVHSQLYIFKKNGACSTMEFAVSIFGKFSNLAEQSLQHKYKKKKKKKALQYNMVIGILAIGSNAFGNYSKY
jgi:hypothetical protein